MAFSRRELSTVFIEPNGQAQDLLLSFCAIGSVYSRETEFCRKNSVSYDTSARRSVEV